jgi:hypothetical protein
MMKIKPIIKAKCEKCGKVQKRDESKSNENWSVFSCNDKCECGGDFRLEIE